MNSIQSINLIATNPDVRNGKPCIAGTGLRVMDVVIASIFHERNPGQIASDYDVSLAQVHAALAYYYEHKDEIDEDIRQHLEKSRELKDKNIGR